MKETYQRQTLASNLAALRRGQPELVERLERPVESDHVDLGPPARYLHHRSWVPLDIDRLDEAPGLEESVGAEGEVTLLGVGTGDLLERLLAAAPDARVLAWDRDPWLLRSALSRADLAERMASGGLRLALGTDLLAVDLAVGNCVEHPLLGRLYRRDIAEARRAAAGPRAAVCTGGLMVESVSDALERAGFGVWPLEVRRVSIEEIDHAMEQLEPELLVAINYTDGLAELAARHGARLLCWEIDPTTTTPTLDPAAADAARVFTWRGRDVEVFRSAGFSQVEHLPIGADLQLRRPLELTATQRERHAAPLSFVGSSLVHSAREFRPRFLERCALAGIDGPQLLAELLAAQRREPERFLIRERLVEQAPALFEQADEEDPAVLVGELAASEKRLTYVANLGRLRIHVWGDPGWEPVEKYGANYRGPAGHGEELTRIYNASAVNVDVGRIYQDDIVTLRTFDVLACGGFALVEHTEQLGELFEVGRELESYATLDELMRKAAHFTEHPDQARAIAERGLAAVRERHSVDLRLARMLNS